MEYRLLGSTGERVSALGLGGAHAARPTDPAETTRLIRAAIDAGVTFLDNCWDYHGGEAEVRMGRALRDGYRERVFLMTKIDAHYAAPAAAQIDQCLRRLQTDRLDLIQIHEVIRPDDPERAFAPGGTMEAPKKSSSSRTTCSRPAVLSRRRVWRRTCSRPRRISRNSKPSSQPCPPGR